MKLTSNLTFDNVIKQYEDKYHRKYYYAQLVELRRGFEEGLDISVYADPDFEHEQMEVIREGLEKGLDVSVYDKLEFDHFQMSQVKYGLENKVDVELYANSKYAAFHMKIIRLCLELNLDVSRLLDENLSYSQVKRIEQQLLDIVEYNIVSAVY